MKKIEFREKVASQKQGKENQEFKIHMQPRGFQDQNKVVPSQPHVQGQDQE